MLNSKLDKITLSSVPRSWIWVLSFDLYFSPKLDQVPILSYTFIRVRNLYIKFGIDLRNAPNSVLFFVFFFKENNHFVTSHSDAIIFLVFNNGKVLSSKSGCKPSRCPLVYSSKVLIILLMELWHKKRSYFKILFAGSSRFSWKSLFHIEQFFFTFSLTFIACCCYLKLCTYCQVWTAF